jgi:hypothetical protein
MGGGMGEFRKHQEANIVKGFVAGDRLLDDIAHALTAIADFLA